MLKVINGEEIRATTPIEQALIQMLPFGESTLSLPEYLYYIQNLRREIKSNSGQLEYRGSLNPNLLSQEEARAMGSERTREYP